MRIVPLIAVLGLMLGALTSPAAALGTDYPALDLLSPCQEADNDARWGEAAEIECEQYLIGYVDALMATGMVGAEAGICLPAQNVADEVRWAFMRWVHQSYSARVRMTSADAVMATLKENFSCE